MPENPELSVYYDDVFLEHAHPDGAFEMPPNDLLAVDEPHPDSPDRIRNIKHIIEQTLGDWTDWPSVEPARREQLELIHDAAYLDEIERLSGSTGGRMSVTTGVSSATWEAIRHAAGASIQAAEVALSADRVPYALVRPSGHHAQPDQADGYCLINNAGVGAAHVLESGQAERVAIIDWDVHPGNGTQECFYDRDDVLVVNLHGDYGAWGANHPQTCRTDERGTGPGEGYSVNVPLPPGTGDRGYALAFERIVEPVVGEYEPDLILASAGQDPGQLDPNGRNIVTMAGFREIGRRTRRLADEFADGSLAVIQEGGYQVSHLAYATLGVLEGVLGYETGVEDPWNLLDESTELPKEWIENARSVHAQDWPVLES